MRSASVMIHGGISIAYILCLKMFENHGIEPLTQDAE